MVLKDKKIIEDSEKEGIPIFVLTAKDILSAKTIRGYLDLCLKGSCKSPHLIGVLERLDEFEDWQRANSVKVKLPD